MTIIVEFILMTYNLIFNDLNTRPFGVIQFIPVKTSSS